MSRRERVAVKHDWFLLGLTGVLLVAVFMLANEALPPW